MSEDQAKKIVSKFRNDAVAKRGSAQFILDTFRSKACDSDGVAGCVRCNALALAIWMLDALSEVEKEDVA